MNESILNSIKKLLGLAPDYEAFDQDLIIHINTAIGVLTQLGVGPSYGFIITGPEERWEELCPQFNTDRRYGIIKTYVYLKTKMFFDPPLTGTVTDSINRSIAELEWRITTLPSLPAQEDDDMSYELPIASENRLGGIKVGENLSIDQNGKLSAVVPKKTSEIVNDNDYVSRDVSDLINYLTAEGVAALLDGKIDMTLLGAANGIAQLDDTGKVPASQLPSFVDDIVEGNMYEGQFYKGNTQQELCPLETGKIYVDVYTNKTYRYSGRVLVEIVQGLALGETASSAYRGDRGKIAYDDSQLNKQKIGAIENLHTILKSSLVAAINEIKDQLDQIPLPDDQGDIYYNTDYNALENKPTLNGVIMRGAKTSSDYGINVPTKTSDLLNDNGYVVDNDYTHTDNNYDNLSRSVVDGVTGNLAMKVDKKGTDRLMTLAEATKLQSLQNYDDTELRSMIENIEEYDDTELRTMIADIDEYDDTEIRAAVAGKVDKVQGKGLSTEDFTTAEKEKLSTAISNTVDNLTNYYDKTTVYTKAEVQSLIAAAKNGTFILVNELPTEDISTNAIYLVPKPSALDADTKDEWINLTGTSAGWERIGGTSVDLSNYVTTSALTTALADKVDKVSGKQLSTEDFTTVLKTKLEGLSNYDDTEIQNGLANKVDKVTGKGLSTNDYTTAEKEKLANLEAGAAANVQSDWTETDDTDDAFIKHKPATGLNADDLDDITQGDIPVAAQTYFEVFGTLAVGAVSLTLSDPRITTDSSIEVFTNRYLVCPTDASISNGAVVLAFEAQESALSVKVRVS